MRGKRGVDTGLYYYGARYYDPRISIWLSVDPLAIYNPVMETEHYGDGQHNGGILNNKNLNVYGYCYQNPVLLIDPNGKQTTNTNLNSALDKARATGRDVYLLNNVGRNGSVTTARNQLFNKTYEMTKIYSGQEGTGSEFVFFNNNRISLPDIYKGKPTSLQGFSSSITFNKVQGRGSDILDKSSINKLNEIAKIISETGQSVDINMNVALKGKKSSEVSLSDGGSAFMNGKIQDVTLSEFGNSRITAVKEYLINQGVSVNQLNRGSVNIVDGGQDTGTIIDIVVPVPGVNSNNIIRKPDWDPVNGNIKMPSPPGE